MVLVGLVFLYLSGIDAYFEYGHWPIYGDPAYSKYSNTAFMCLFFSIFISIAGVIVQLVKLPLFFILKPHKKVYFQCLIYLSVFLLLILDPAGLLNWYLD